MANDRGIGGAILGGSILGIIVYGLLIYFWTLLVLEATAFLAVLALLGVLAWIGYTMATTSPPEPIADIAGPATSAAAPPGNASPQNATAPQKEDERPNPTSS